jgi:small subunit ribosomal protein S29e
MPNKLFEKRPKNYGKDSRVCRHTGTTRGVIQKYGMNISRRSFREIATTIGFIKVSCQLILEQLSSVVVA